MSLLCESDRFDPATITVSFFIVRVEMVFNTNVSTELTLVLDCKNN